MSKIIGIILLIAGLVLVYQGLSRRDSLAGQAAEAGTEIANSVDGGTRQPQHIFTLLGGGALIVAGGILTFRRSAAV